MEPLWRTVCWFLKKLKTELPYDPVIPLLGIYLDKTITGKDTRTPMFIADYSQQPRDGSKLNVHWQMNGQRRCGLATHTHTHNGTLLTPKEWNNAICSNMHGSTDYHTKWRQRNTNTRWYHLCVESKMRTKKFTKELI